MVQYRVRCTNDVHWYEQFLQIGRPYRALIRYDSAYLTCSKKLTGSQLKPPHGTNKKLKCKTKNKTMSMIGPVQSRCHEGSPVGKRNLRWEGFVEKVGWSYLVFECVCFFLSSWIQFDNFCLLVWGSTSEYWSNWPETAWSTQYP